MHALYTSLSLPAVRRLRKSIVEDRPEHGTTARLRKPLADRAS